MRLQRVHASAVRIALVGELRHRAVEIAARVHEVELALQLRDSRLHLSALCFGSGSQATLRGCDLRLYFRAPPIQLLLHPLQRLRRGSRIRSGFLRHICFAAQQLCVGSGDFEGEANGLVGNLPISVQDEQIARLSSRLLLGAQGAVPIHGLIEDPHDLLARHHGARSYCLRRGRCRRGTRRIGRDGPIEQRSRREQERKCSQQ